MKYMMQYQVDSAYIEDQKTHESRHTYKKRIYNTMLYYTQSRADMPVMWIQRIWPQEDWGSVWGNLHETPIPSNHKTTWYRVIHDIMRTNMRLFKIRMSSSERRRHCGNLDTLIHRFTSCGEGQLLWYWTANKIAVILPTEVKHILQ
jgi:hypothetical protein